MTHSLSLYNISGAPSIAADMSHVATAGEVNGYISEKLGNALQGTKIVVIAAGVPQKPNIAVGEDAPEAHILITSNPMNSTVSIVTEVLKKASKFNPAKLSAEEEKRIQAALPELKKNIEKGVNFLSA
ncbi:hypothetical protein BS47DRAFT_1397721 [Hydnum rufescens UP504]|uniref:malate dehydrogenase n=1 Tax=Hydnum rufescens UP504 TaxID=1448309 RepID=A0A9P6AN43_9AGAM|nr:hypothetical protein BS47DRAFT_1397721 [Hydnum rufescens UP504]